MKRGLHIAILGICYVHRHADRHHARLYCPEEPLFAVLEQQVLPAFFERDADGLPTRWVEMMRHSIAELGTEFSTNRMVREYVERLYLPAHRDLAAALTAA